MSTYTWKPVALHLCLLLQQDGFTLDCADNYDEEVPFNNDLDTFVDCLTACDEARLFISRPFEFGGTRKLGVFLVFGNEPHETVADYSVDEKLEATLEKFEDFWSRRRTPLAEAEASWVEEVRGVFGKPDREPTRQELHDKVVAQVLTEVAANATPPAPAAVEDDAEWFFNGVAQAVSIGIDKAFAANATPPDERPTPITDAETMRDEYDHVDSEFGPFAPSDMVPADFARDLERQLAERTEQRDRLAEAVLKYNQGTLSISPLIDLARAALAAVKGGAQ